MQCCLASLENRDKRKKLNDSLPNSVPSCTILSRRTWNRPWHSTKVKFWAGVIQKLVLEGFKDIPHAVLCCKSKWILKGGRKIHHICVPSGSFLKPNKPYDTSEHTWCHNMHQSHWTGTAAPGPLRAIPHSQGSWSPAPAAPEVVWQGALPKGLSPYTSRPRRDSMEMNKVTQTPWGQQNFIIKSSHNKEKKKSGLDTSSVCKLQERLSNSKDITSKNLVAGAEK